MLRKLLMSERYDSRVGAEFDDKEAAQNAASAIREQTPLPATNVRIIGPGEERPGRKLEPESGAIARTMVRAHLVLGAAGLVLGMLLAALLIGTDVQPFVSSPGFAFGAIAAIGLVLGLLFGGLVGFRPDHDAVIFAAGESAAAGHWYVVVHTSAPEQNRNVQEILGRYSNRRLRSI